MFNGEKVKFFEFKIFSCNLSIPSKKTIFVKFGLIKSDYIPAFLYGEIGMNNKIDNTTKMLYFKLPIKSPLIKHIKDLVPPQDGQKKPVFAKNIQGGKISSNFIILNVESIDIKKNENRHTILIFCKKH